MYLYNHWLAICWGLGGTAIGLFLTGVILGVILTECFWCWFIPCSILSTIFWLTCVLIVYLPTQIETINIKNDTINLTYKNVYEYENGDFLDYDTKSIIHFNPNIIENSIITRTNIRYMKELNVYNYYWKGIK